MSVTILTTEAQQKMRRAGALAAGVLNMIGDHVKVGVSTGELDQICHDYIVNDIDSIPAPLNYTTSKDQPPFPRSICTSVNQVVCHGIPDENRILRKGDIVNIDITVIKDGYHGDTSKMFIVGKPKTHTQRLVDVTQQCLYKGIDAVRPGATLGDIGHVIQKHAESFRFSIVREFCGHGIGAKFHDAPQVLHYGTPGHGMELVPGMAFTIEPMVNAGRRHIRLLPDLWTVVTRDHKLSAQWEHTILVTDDGREVLTLREEEDFC